PDVYYDLFTAMIKAWRNEWGTELPFYFVQITPFGYSDLDAAARLREAQYNVSKTVPGTGMVATADIGDMKDGHPIHKKEVGERLARMALAKTYARNGIVDKGPEVNSIRLRKGKVYIEFDQTICVAKGDRPQGFELGFRDQETGALRYVEATAERKRNTVVVSSEEGDHPVEIRYARMLAGEGNISNHAGLPAYPFRKAIPQR